MFLACSSEILIFFYNKAHLKFLLLFGLRIDIVVVIFGIEDVLFWRKFDMKFSYLQHGAMINKN